jgi:hypothetical protein
MSSNLPPGVEPHMIPGNTPEDVEYENFHTRVEQMLEEDIGPSRSANFFGYIEAGDWEEVLRTYVDIAAGLAAAKAIMEANYEREMARELEGDNEANDS